MEKDFGFQTKVEAKSLDFREWHANGGWLQPVNTLKITHSGLGIISRASIIEYRPLYQKNMLLTKIIILFNVKTQHQHHNNEWT